MTTSPPPLSFGRWLRVAREEAGLSQLQVADAIGVSRSLVTQWETDRLWPHLAQITDLIRIYDAPWLGDLAREVLATDAPWLVT